MLGKIRKSKKFQKQDAKLIPCETRYAVLEGHCGIVLFTYFLVIASVEQANKQTFWLECGKP